MTPNQIKQIAADYTAAWNSKSAPDVAAFYAPDGQIVINNGDPWQGRDGVRDMALGFYADVPDLSLTCDDVRLSATHAIFVWTFTGHAADTGHPLNVSGWEEWDLNADNKVRFSRGWFDADDYARQASGQVA